MKGLALAVMLGAVVGIVVCFMTGCAGPSKARLQVLLHECREQNRERVRVIREYEGMKCERHPESAHGVLNFGEAGF